MLNVLTSIEAKKEGLIKHIGFSCHDLPANMIKLLDTGLFESMILQYNLLDTRNEEVIAHAKQKGIGILTMGSVGGGRLAAPSEALMKMIDKPVASTAELALRFVLSNLGVSSALSGMNTVDMVRENTATASIDKPLTQIERRLILDALEEKKKLSDLYCTGCGYCMPCPNGVDISGNFNLVNYFRLYGLEEYAKNRYIQLGKRMEDGKPRPAWAEACQECGECEEKCPQNIEIRNQLNEAKILLS
jgi:predicted aldo/keto reductase-like oxidoreductase